MSAGGAVSKEWSPKIARPGRRRDRQLLRLALRPRRAADRAGGECRRDRAASRKKNIIANPNCSTAQLVVALKPLHDARHDQARRRRDLPVGLRRRQGRAWTSCSRRPGASTRCSEVEAKKFPKRIAFNLIPQIDVFMEDGYTKEEWKMMAETKKILDPKIKLTATCVRVPVFIGHSEAVNIEFEKPITADEAREILRAAPGCLVIDKREPGGYITPLRGGRRGRHLHLPHPRGHDGRERPRPVVRLRQPAQGRRAQRRADRRSAGQPQADPPKQKAA